MSTNNDDNKDDLPPLSEQTRRPADTALLQQRVKAWYPYLDPWWVIIGFAILGAIFIPVGYYITAASDSIFEGKIQYDAFDLSSSVEDCGINITANAQKLCEFNISITQDLEPPILIHYEIDNFHQNHRAYQQSRDSIQLKGRTTQTALAAQNCAPLNKIGGVRLNPCGLIANTLFNDVITLENEDITMIEEGIAWTSDIEHVYNQPDGFNKSLCPNIDPNSSTTSPPNSTTLEECCNDSDWSCGMAKQYHKDGKYYRYHYPNENETQYLYETYNSISPLDGVLDEHFIVWMRVAALPKFRKLYGWIDQPLKTGMNLTFSIQNNWEVTSFKGRKSLVVSKGNVFGGKNNAMGKFYFGVGWFCIITALFFALKQTISPRLVADPKYLRYKED